MRACVLRRTAAGEGGLEGVQASGCTCTAPRRSIAQGRDVVDGIALLLSRGGAQFLHTTSPGDVALP